MLALAQPSVERILNSHIRNVCKELYHGKPVLWVTIVNCDIFLSFHFNHMKDISSSVNENLSREELIILTSSKNIALNI